MHDPLTVAFDIVRPWPQRDGMRPHPGDPRWQIRHRHKHHYPYCADNHCTGVAFPWWKPRSYARFWTLAGRRFYWPALVTVWHREPRGRDSGEVCKHYRRVFDEDTRKWRTKPVNRWRWHVHHWKIQVPPLQHLRRQLLTRCSWCGGKSRKGDLVNFSSSWDGPRGHWWRGEPGLYHQDCIDVERVYRTCMCAVPVLDHGDGGDGWGKCQACGGFRGWRQEPDDADRLILELVPRGGRMTAEARVRIEAAWAERRARRQAAETAEGAEDR
jgi:hypothetical protein